MAGMIDWGAIQPHTQAPHTEIPSMAGMLEAIAARRWQQEKFAQDAEFKRIDDAREMWRIKTQEQRLGDEAKAKSQHEQDVFDAGQVKERETKAKDIADLVGHGDTARAASLAQSYGMPFQKHEAVLAPMPPGPPPMELGAAPAEDPDAIDRAGIANWDEQRAAIEPQRQAVLARNARQQEAAKTTYDLTIPAAGRVMPADRRVFMSTLADASMREDRAAQAAPVLDDMERGGLGGEPGSPAAKALHLVRVGVSSGALPPEKDAIFARYTTELARIEDRVAKEKNARIVASGRGTGNNFKTMTELRGQLRQFDTDNNIRVSGKEYGEIDKAAHMIASQSGPGQKAGVEGFIKAARGGAVTKASQDYVAGNMAGGVAQFQTAMQKAVDGQFSDPDVKALETAIVDARSAIKAEVARAARAFDIGFGGPEYTEVQGNIINEYNKRFTSFGLPEKARGGGEPGVTITGKSLTGDRQRSGQTASGAPEDYLDLYKKKKQQQGGRR